MSYEVRTMSIAELDLAVEWAAREGWNPGLHDTKPFYQADPNGFLIGVLDGERIGCISAVSYPENFGFIGFYIMKPEFRGKGYGIQLWNRAVEQLKGLTVGLDGVVEQQSNYAKSGFALAYSNIRFEGEGAAPFEHPNIVPAAANRLDEIAKFDRRFFPSARQEFLNAWLSLEDSQSIAFEEEGEIRGWSVIRRCREGFKIGPLFAESAEIANALFQTQRGFAGEGEKVYLDIPEVNPDACALVGANGMTKVFETARMYSGDAPNIDVSGVYGVTTFELG